MNTGHVMRQECASTEETFVPKARKELKRVFWGKNAEFQIDERAFASVKGTVGSRTTLWSKENQFASAVAFQTGIYRI